MAELNERTGLSLAACEVAVRELLSGTSVEQIGERYRSLHFEVPVGQSHGWEAAVLDHYQALVNAVAAKLGSGSKGARHKEVVGGATYTFDLPAGHPLEERVLAQLTGFREHMETLRAEVDAVNEGQTLEQPRQVVFYMGQYVKE
jgi:hypothetical protein